MAQKELTLKIQFQEQYFGWVEMMTLVKVMQMVDRPMMGDIEKVLINSIHHMVDRLKVQKKVMTKAHIHKHGVMGKMEDRKKYTTVQRTKQLYSIQIAAVTARFQIKYLEHNNFVR